MLDERKGGHLRVADLDAGGVGSLVEFVVQLIAATTTRSGLRVHAELDEGVYPKGVKISDADMKALPLVVHAFHGDWNYTLHPEPIVTTM